jgi:hypothetical protein
MFEPTDLSLCGEPRTTEFKLIYWHVRLKFPQRRKQYAFQQRMDVHCVPYGELRTVFGFQCIISPIAQPILLDLDVLDTPKRIQTQC